jgi:alginate O-acetyltransferase complex protein AlgI
MTRLIEYFLLGMIVMPASWIVPSRFSMPLIMMATAGFLAYCSPWTLLILTSMVCLVYYVLYKSPIQDDTKIAVCLAVIICALIWAKIKLSFDHHWIIPLGLSYYSFRNIHFVLDYYRGQYAGVQFKEYLAYNFFLPVMLVGPINRFNDFWKDYRRRRYDSANVSYGLERIVYGFSKVVIVANFLIAYKLGRFADGLQNEHLWWYTFLKLNVFVFNAFSQFAGYSDIAIGLARIAGFRINENFNYPFLAKNMREFWTRYHISLSDFCRDYIYSPVASRFRNPRIGVLITMVVIGLWHELSFRYLAWGAVQFMGIFLAGYPFLPDHVVNRVLNRVGTTLFFVLSCVLINTTSFTAAADIYKILFFLN